MEGSTILGYAILASCVIIIIALAISIAIIMIRTAWIKSSRDNRPLVLDVDELKKHSPFIKK